ncbi:MAG: phosphoadenylyl-sulfate reductase [Bacillus sp. (in: firmicutes)]
MNVLYETFAENQLPVFSADSKWKGAYDTLKWAYDQYGEHLLYACSFGIEGSVLLHLISQVKADAQVVFLDTDVHFKETYETIERTEARYPSLQIIKKKPSLTLNEQAEQYGAELWKSKPDLCCQLRKVQPLEEELKKADAWLSGLRREQSPTRANVNFINKDDRFQSVKVCPLIHWTWEDIWNYVKEHDLPYNTLHDQNYPSIGCEPCTKPSLSNSRDGRWIGQGKLECGLHNSPIRRGEKTK